MSIVDLADFKAYVRDEASGINDEILQGYLDAASQALNNACGRQFVVAGTAAARLFAATPGVRVLPIDDATTVTAITENGSAVASTQYQLEPLNGRSPGGETIPYSGVRRSYQYWYTDSYRALISVTATWGWAAIPYQIVEACKVLGKELCNNQDVRLGIVAVTDEAISGIRTNKIVRDAVRDYARGEQAFVIA